MVRGLSAVRSRVIPKVNAAPGVMVTVAIFAVVFTILAYFSAPGISFHDSGEFSLAAATNGLPHSPGAPTWAILNQIFRLFTFGAEGARSANLFSAFCGAVTIAFASAFVFRHFADRSRTVQWLAATVTGLSLLCTGSFLEQSFIAEQYTLLTMLMSGILLVIQTNHGAPKASWYYGMGVLWGLAMGNHPSQIILGFLMLLPVIQERKTVSIFKSVPMGFLGLLTGLLVFIWLPYRSAAHPALAWGHPDTLRQFLWNIGREQWPTRGITQAPAGFIKGWFNSYNLFSEMGIVSTILAVCGVVLGFRRALKPLSWILMAIVPYSLLMLAGHLHQEGMDLIYLRYYGVRDWHIPVFMGFSMLGGMAVVWLLDMRSRCTEKVRIGTLSTVALSMGGFFPFQLSRESMRSYTDASTYAHNYLDTLPKDAILATFCDNSSHIVGYEHYANKMAPSVYFTFGMPQNIYGLEFGPDGKPSNGKPEQGWNLELKKSLLQDFIFRPALNPLSLPYKMSDEEIARRPLFTEYVSNDLGDFYDYCLPHGWVLQVLEHKTTNEEVLKADTEFMAAHPELSSRPAPGFVHRLSREAFSYAHLRRGLFFMKRKMWKQVKSELETALAWEPQNPQILFPFGAALEELKDYEGAEHAYLMCIDSMPDFATPRQNLALLYLYAGDKNLALKYAKEELALVPNAKNTQQLVAILEKGKK